MSTLTEQPANGKATALLSKIAYQPFGPVASWNQGNGGTYSRTYDQDGRVARLALPPSNAIALTYDAASRITGMAETGLSAKAFGYDALDRIVNYASGTAAQTYAYDASGNRAASTKTVPPAANVALTYNYDKGSNRLLSIGGNWSGNFTFSYTENFTYDANGNTLSHSSPFANYTYTYNARNRRTQTYLASTVMTDVINGLGQRSAQTQAGATDHFVYDEAGHLTGSYNGSGGVLDETVWLSDLPVAVLSGGQPSYILPDHLGAPHQITDARGQVEWQWDHDPFGNGLPTGSFSYDLRFPGQVYDQKAQLHYNYFRDYDPNTGRYIESDPIGLAGSANTYGYVGQNPVWASDPLGLCEQGDVTCQMANRQAGVPQFSTPDPRSNQNDVGGLPCMLGCAIGTTPLCIYIGRFPDFGWPFAIGCAAGRTVACACLCTLKSRQQQQSSQPVPRQSPAPLQPSPPID